MNVYDFKGKGVAMSMYNTDEVRIFFNFEELYSWLCSVVYHWFCAFFVQDGFGEEDAVGKCRIIVDEDLYPEFFSWQFMSTKNTIMKKYDGRFKDIFQEVYESWVFETVF